MFSQYQMLDFWAWNTYQTITIEFFPIPSVKAILGKI